MSLVKPLCECLAEFSCEQLPNGRCFEELGGEAVNSRCFQACAFNCVIDLFLCDCLVSPRSVTKALYQKGFSSAPLVRGDGFLNIEKLAEVVGEAVVFGEALLRKRLFVEASRDDASLVLPR